MSVTVAVIAEATTKPNMIHIIPMILEKTRCGTISPYLNRNEKSKNTIQFTEEIGDLRFEREFILTKYILAFYRSGLLAAARCTCKGNFKDE